jgi:hypothetical protein
MKLKYIRSLALAVTGLSTIIRIAQAGAAGLIVHEWGTFTSLQGGDGKLLAWQPLRLSRLPEFVYNWSRPGFERAASALPAGGGKFTLMALQRLETPVVYFYSDREQKMDLTVNFPNGWITEWFPRADLVSRVAEEGVICWSNLTLVPAGRRSELPTHAATAHDPYFAARETDSDLVRVSATNEIEKFLFYRGAGNFKTPLRVTMKGPFSVTLANTGNETLSHLFLLDIRNQDGNFISIDALGPGEERTIVPPSATKLGLRPGDELELALGNSMVAALAQSGLYPLEAQAMVNTWKDLWFRENGLRVLYVLPRTWTDSVLPMTLKPLPKKLTRVMVGRAEILSPGLEEKLARQITEAKEGNPAASARVCETLKFLGRFAEPAFIRAVAAAKLQSDERVKMFELLNKASAFE